MRGTPTRKQSMKSVALKRGSAGDKENLCNGVQLSKLVTREFEGYLAGVMQQFSREGRSTFGSKEGRVVRF